MNIIRSGSFWCSRIFSSSLLLKRYGHKHARVYSIKELLGGGVTQTGEKIVIKGWVRLCRSQKNVVFLNISDGSCTTKLQVVIPASSCRKPPAIGSSVEVSGNLIKSTHQGQPYELQADAITLLGDMLDSNYPFHSGKQYALKYLRQYPHLRTRTNVFQSLMRLRSQATMQIHKYFQDYNYVYVHSPIITSSNCEGAGDLFTVSPQHEEEKPANGPVEDQINFFNGPSFLTVSGQLHAEALMSSLSHVYTFGPAFRAEKSHTRHHLAEFYMIEAESTSFDCMDSLIKKTERFIKDTISNLLVACPEDLSSLDKFVPTNHKETLNDFLNSSCARMTYTEAVKALEIARQKFSKIPRWGEELRSDHENYLIQENGNKGLFITDYPAKLRPFYCRKNDNDTVAAFDLLVPFVGELVGGSLREERFDLLLNNMQTFNISKESYSWYLDLRRYGTIPHGGFGMGFERFLQFMLGVTNIRDTVPFPRYSGSCKL